LHKEKRGRRDAYARAGVDVGKVRSMQAMMAKAFESTFSSRNGKFGEPGIGIGHYAGLIDIGSGRLLGLHTDNVGTKVLVAQQLRRFDTVGIDCIAMTVNDLICMGCEPLALLDHMSLEREDAHLVEQLSQGLVDGAKQAGAAIVGGETAIVGDIVKGIDGHGFDLISMGVGVVAKSAVIDGSAIRNGDALVGIASSGLHSNGYTLARRILQERSLEEEIDELGESIGEALLRPTTIYVKPTLETLRRREIHGIAHITGGAFTKLMRLIGKRKLKFSVDDLKGSAPSIFGFLQREGHLSDAEMYETFNMGVGLCLVTPRAEVEAVIRDYRRRGFVGKQVGLVEEGRGVVVGGGTTRIV
jgi:phosphoribosylformylglycinamidine cyclo-ligase